MRGHGPELVIAGAPAASMGQRGAELRSGTTVESVLNRFDCVCPVLKNTHEVLIRVKNSLIYLISLRLTRRGACCVLSRLHRF